MVSFLFIEADYKIYSKDVEKYDRKQCIKSVIQLVPICLHTSL